MFTKCKESLQDGRRLENISWRLWYREIMRDGAPPLSSAPSPADSPNVSRIGSTERLCEEKAEKDKKKEREMNSEKGGEKHASSETDVVVVDASHSVPSHFALFASELQQRPLSATPAPIPTPQSPPPAYALGFDFGSSKDQDDDRIPEPGASGFSFLLFHFSFFFFGHLVAVFLAAFSLFSSPIFCVVIFLFPILDFFIFVFFLGYFRPVFSPLVFNLALRSLVFPLDSGDGLHGRLESRTTFFEIPVLSFRFERRLGHGSPILQFGLAGLDVGLVSRAGL